MSSVSGLVARFIPERGNRTLWWLILLTAVALGVLGPLAAAASLSKLFDRPVATVLLLLLGTNLVAMIAAGAVMVPLLNGPTRVSRARGIAVAALVAAAATAVRLAVFYAAAASFGIPTGWRFQLTQVGLGLLLLGCVAAAIVYGDSLVQALDVSYAANARTSVALAHEEEAVRAQVFDQLHGNLQAEFVAMGRILDDLAQRTSDPEAAATAEALTVRMEAVYRRGVETVARALSPAGLDAGLVPAVQELQGRLAGATDLHLSVDPIVAALDNPTTGGIRYDVRVAAYRVAEEAVSNAVRHSGARVVAVDLSSTLRDGQPQLFVRVTNPRQSRAEVTDGQGLTRMRARVAALGGDVRITSSADEFVVSARFPLQRPESA